MRKWWVLIVVVLVGCQLPYGSEETVEIVADVAGTIWPPAKWILLGVFGIATASGAVVVKKKGSK
jgi:hypothetical protein